MMYLPTFKRYRNYTICRIVLITLIIIVLIVVVAVMAQLNINEGRKKANPQYYEAGDETGKALDIGIMNYIIWFFYPLDKSSKNLLLKLIVYMNSYTIILTYLCSFG